MRGDGTVYLRGSTWWIKFHRDGKPVAMSCKGLTEAQAKTRLKHEMRKPTEEFIEPKVKRVTVGELVADALKDIETRGKYDHRDMTEQRWNKHLKPVFGSMKAHALGTSQLRAYREQRTKEGASNATINRELQILLFAFKLGYEHEPPKVRRVPAFKKMMLREDNARQGFVNVTQLEAVRTEAGKAGLAYRVLVELAHWLGWRRGELLHLRVSNVHLFDGGPNGSIRLEAHETKAHKAREVAMSPTLRLYMEQMVVGKKPTDYILPWRWLDYTVWRKIVDAAGCPDLHLHDLRRSSARSKRSAGVPESVIMEMQGWATGGMFRRYAIVDATDKIDALQKQEAYEARQLRSATITLQSGKTDA